MIIMKYNLKIVDHYCTPVTYIMLYIQQLSFNKKLSLKNKIHIFNIKMHMQRKIVSVSMVTISISLIIKEVNNTISYFYRIVDPQAHFRLYSSEPHI